MTVSESSAAKGRVGTVLGRKWRIEERLGAGSSATVYRAEHWNNGRKVAVKVLHPDAARSAESRGRFLREGRLANSIDHEGVVGVIDDGETDDGCPFIIMELVEGKSLEELRRACPDGRLPLREALNACVDVLDVLAVAHAAGVVHRDIKPRNVLVTNEGQLKLVDFGIAGAAESESSVATRTGAGLGTPLYMAPEQLTGDRPIDARADVWGVGAMLYVLLSGQFPFAHYLPLEYLEAARSAPPRLDTVVPGVPAALADVVERALVFEPAERWSGARVMAEALEAVVVPGPDGKPAPSFADHTEQMVTLLRANKPAPGNAKGGTVPMPMVVPASTAPMMAPLPIPRAAVPTVTSEHRKHELTTRRFVVAVVGGALAAVVIVAVLWFASTGLLAR
jgi:eukaryotic-like serine/threonine-protein kinase